MSKIICDVCGTSYPETATQCPICGCVRPSDVTVVAGDTNEEIVGRTSSYTYVKGGKFSKSNVRRRSQPQQSAQDETAEPLPVRQDRKRNEDKGLVIAVCVLLLAIVAVAIYITLHFFGQAPAQKPGLDAQTTAGSTVSDTTDTISTVLPCTDILISKTSVTLTKAGETSKLNVTVNPADTTDTIMYTSSDDTVASVSEDGTITAMTSGEATITVTCGNATATCRVICDIPADETTSTQTTENEEEQTPGGANNNEEQQTPDSTSSVISFNREDFTVHKNETWTLYKGEIPVEQITWSSDNENVAKIENGIVTAVGVGQTVVYAEYNGTKISCIVRVKA